MVRVTPNCAFLTSQLHPGVGIAPGPVGSTVDIPLRKSGIPALVLMPATRRGVGRRARRQGRDQEISMSQSPRTVRSRRHPPRPCCHLTSTRERNKMCAVADPRRQRVQLGRQHI